MALSPTSGKHGGGFLFDLPARTVASPALSVGSTSSSSSLTVTSPLRKHRFDDRSQTKISIALKSHQSGLSHNVFKVPEIKTSPLISNEILKWTETTTISAIINSPEFVSNHGSVIYTEPSSIYVALGTNKGRIVVFNYHQGVEFILGIEETDDGNGSHEIDRELHQELEISTIGFSSDSTYLAAGYTNGQVRIWDLSSKSSKTFPGTISPYFTINPITLQERFTKNRSGHLRNTPITSIGFIGDSHDQLISIDISGLVFYHIGIKKFLQKHFISQKILGKNDANVSDSKHIIHGCSILPLGSSHQITDQLGVMAVITSNILVIVSVLSLNNPHSVHLIDHFKIGKSKQVANSDNISACLDWFPCMTVNEKTLNAKLAYSWNNVLTILELDNNSFPSNLSQVLSDMKDKDKAISKLPISKLCRWNTDHKYESIVGVKWLSSDIICVFIRENEETKNLKVTALYFSENTLRPVGHDNVLGMSISTSSLNGNSTRTPTTNNTNAETTQLTSFGNSIKVFKHRLMVLSETPLHSKRVFIARSLSWADVLLSLLSGGKYAEALTTANEFYNSTNTGKLVLVGLPDRAQERYKLIRPYLVQIMKESIPHLFGNSAENQQYYLVMYLDIISYLAVADSTDDLSYLLELIFEQIADNNLFFEKLESYTLSSSISSLPPLILKKLVEYYVQNDKGELLTEILCILDIKTLDIDLTIQLCNQYKLRDCLIYIWNYLLDDYETPLIDFIKDFKDPNFFIKEDYFRAYSYISYVLTGKQYPTDRIIDSPKDVKAKESICDILFSNTTITWPAQSDEELSTNNDDTIFPYLYCFLKPNAFEMLSTLNEFFEEPYLNDNQDKKLNRQYITEALLDVFDANEYLFSDEDRCQLAIFIGRNYAKYSQFIRLSESILGRIIDDLCANTDPRISGDCELALQSLLPHYEPENDDLLNEKLNNAKYYNVLLNIYKSEGRYSKVLEVWLGKLMNDPTDDFHDESLSVILENSFMLTKSAVDRMSLIHVIKVNFERFASIDLSNFLVLISRFAPQLHSEALEIKDETLMFKYLEELFKQKNVESLDTSELSKLLVKFVELLCTYGQSKLYSFVTTWKSFLANDNSQLRSTLITLKNHEAIDSYAALLVHEENYSEALSAILEFMNSKMNELEEERMVNKFSQLLKQAMTICELSQTYEEYEKGLSLNEKMWLDLIENLVNMASKKQQEGKIHRFLNKCIHDCFRAISDAKLNPNVHDSDHGKKEKSFLTIFNKFLDSSSDNSTLANVRGILQENFISYSYESEMLQISLSMLNQGIYKQLKQIKIDNIKGWSIHSKNCASCGKLMWGPGIPEDHFSAWEDKQRDTLYIQGSRIGAPFDTEKYVHCQLIFFKCNHGYHTKCLHNLGAKLAGKDLACVICAP
ncbi:vacuolar sorting protein [Scheffersomyces xylosifermentans]|uniref:vacuolar sorting protein n=1 Tax=Scheffersomyces xylosifermentans TaxID=1304137 RepID=UPI00315D25B3